MSFYPKGQNYLSAEDFPHIRDFYRKERVPALSSRGPAAELLEEVARVGSTGNFPHHISCEELGYALARIALNAREEEPLMKIIRGWVRYENDHPTLHHGTFPAE